MNVMIKIIFLQFIFCYALATNFVLQMYSEVRVICGKEYILWKYSTKKNPYFSKDLCTLWCPLRDSNPRPTD